MTQKILKKKPKKGSKSAKPITKTENCESFFNFFKPPQLPEDDDDIDDDLVGLASSYNSRIRGEFNHILSLFLLISLMCLSIG